MEILSRAVGRRKEAVAQVQLVLGTGQFIINDKTAESYLQYNNFSLLKIKSPFEVLLSDTNSAKSSEQNEIANIQTNLISNEKAEDKELSATNQINKSRKIDTIVKVKGGGLIGQVDAIKLALTRAICKLDQNLDVLGTASTNTNPRKIFKLKGFLTQDSRIKERRKYGLKKARKAPQYSKR
jgi:small subunit ribosomal protein S9